METLKDPSPIVLNKKKHRRLNKFGVTFVILLLVSSSLIGYKVYNKVRKQKIYESLNISFSSNREIEYGTDSYNPLDLVKKVSDGEIKSYTEKVDTSTVGKKEIVFEVVKDDVVKKVSVEVLVKDTKAPTIELKNSQVSITAGDAFDVKSNIDKVTDVVDGEIPFSENETKDSAYYIVSTDLDVNTVGNYNVNVKASDANGNVNEASYQVSVAAKPKPIVTTVNKTNNNGGSTYNGPSSVDTSSVVNAAKSLIGSRYVSGGTNPTTGFDCSGFVQYVYGAVGKSISRSSRTQINDGSSVDESNLQPGDIIIWANNGSNSASHSSVYAGDNTIIHATTNKGVQQTNLSGWKSWGRQHIIDIRRI